MNQCWYNNQKPFSICKTACSYLKMIFDCESLSRPMNHGPKNCYLKSTYKHIPIKPQSNKSITLKIISTIKLGKKSES